MERTPPSTGVEVPVPGARASDRELRVRATMTQELTAESFPRRTRDRQNGFSLVEALIVVAIGMILMGIAIPMVQSALRIYTLNSATSNLSGMVQQTRYVAINQGSDACTLLAGNQFGIDANCNGALDSTEIRIQIPIDVTVQTSSSSTSTSSMPFPTGTMQEFTCGTYAARFNSRGSKTDVCGTTGFGVVITHILYVTGWGNTNAVTITGTGRAKSWRWDGAAWR